MANQDAIGKHMPIFYNHIDSKSILPNSPQGCQGIVLTHGDQMGGWAGSWAGGEKMFVRAVSQKL